MDDKDPKYIVPALERGIQLLSAFSRDEPELSMGEIHSRVGLPYATTYRLVYTLAAHRLLQKTKAGYKLGPGILGLGFEYLTSLPLVEVAHEPLQSLRTETGLSANLGILDENDVMYVAHVPSTKPLSARMVVGSRLPVTQSSIGRLILGSMPEAEARALIKRVDPGQDDHAIDEVLALCAEDLKRGYVVAHGRYDVGIVVVAAPIYNQRGEVVAGVNVSGPSTASSTEDLNSVIKDRVCDAAAVIASSLGHYARTDRAAPY